MHGHEQDRRGDKESLGDLGGEAEVDQKQIAGRPFILHPIKIHGSIYGTRHTFLKHIPTIETFFSFRGFALELKSCHVSCNLPL